MRVAGEAVQAPTTAQDCATWQQAVAAFIAGTDVRESSRGLYARQLKYFFAWVEENGLALQTLTRADVLAYKDDITKRGLSPLTVGGYLTALRKFYEWAEAEQIYPNICKGVKTPRRKQEFVKQHLTEDMSAELLRHFQDVSLRDYAIVNLMLRTGLRTIEVVRANIRDITRKGNRRLLRVWGKGHDTTDDFVVLTDMAYKPIADYLATRKGAHIEEPLFTSSSRRNTGERLTTRTISGVCKNGMKAIGLDAREFSAHSLRHTTAVTILKHGGSLMDAQKTLRHSNPATTEIYLKSIEEERRLEKAPEDLLDDAFKV